MVYTLVKAKGCFASHAGLVAGCAPLLPIIVPYFSHDVPFFPTHIVCSSGDALREICQSCENNCCANSTVDHIVLKKE